MDRTMGRIGAAAAAVCLAATGPSAEALQGDGARQTSKLSFATEEPGAATAVSFNIDYVNPDNPDGKPPAVRKIVTEFAPGTRIDTSVPQACTASDAELMASGPEACPPGSKVGTGFATIDTGFPGPDRYLEEDLVFLNNRDELIFLFIDRATGARIVNRSEVNERGTVTVAPTLPGTPPDGGAVDTVQLQIEKVTRMVAGTRRAFITTPPGCPTLGAWTNIARFTYFDGVTQPVRTRSACAAPPSGPCSHVIRGGPGRDRLRGTGVGDRLLGSSGADRFAVTAARTACGAGAGTTASAAAPGQIACAEVLETTSASTAPVATASAAARRSVELASSPPEAWMSARPRRSAARRDG